MILQVGRLGPEEHETKCILNTGPLAKTRSNGKNEAKCASKPQSILKKIIIFCVFLTDEGGKMVFFEACTAFRKTCYLRVRFLHGLTSICN